MTRIHFVLTALLLCTACSDSTSVSAPTPVPSTSPTPVTLTRVSVVGPTSITSSTQFRAEATLSDGTTFDVTASSRWDSSDSAIATVVSSGLLEPKATGQIDVRATYQSVVGTLALQVEKAPVQVSPVSGTVTDASTGLALSDVLVRVIAGTEHIVTSTTDLNGRYTLSVPAGRIVLEFTRSCYQTRSADLMVPDEQTKDVNLTRDSTGSTCTAAVP